jgi:hypothetical protein
MDKELGMLCVTVALSASCERLRAGDVEAANIGVQLARRHAMDRLRGAERTRALALVNAAERITFCRKCGWEVV